MTRRTGLILGVRWQIVLGIGLLYCGGLGLMINGIDWAIDNKTPRYDYRLVRPAEAIHLINDDGWLIAERVPMTSEAVYIYRRHR